MVGSLLYYFVWLFLDRDHWLRRLSIVCVLAAAALNVMLLWTRGSDSRWIVDSMLGGAVALLVLSLGALMLPHVSEVCRRAKSTSPAARQRYVSLWQVLAFLATVGLLLSQLQFVPLRQFAVLAEPARLLWAGRGPRRLDGRPRLECGLVGLDVATYVVQSRLQRLVVGRAVWLALCFRPRIPPDRAVG